MSIISCCAKVVAFFTTARKSRAVVVTTARKSQKPCSSGNYCTQKPCNSVEIPVHRELCSENTPPVAAQVTQSRSVGVIFPDITSGRRPQVMLGKVTPTRLLCHECCYVAYFHYTTSDVPVYPISIIYFLSKYEDKNVAF